MDEKNIPQTNKEVCFVVTGSVDAGKSSTIGVFTSLKSKNDQKNTNDKMIDFDDNSCLTLDNGDGSARVKVAKHPHEIKLGKTSDISSRTIELNEKQLTFVDLCGHEKYLKTTLYGITGFFPDYGILIVSANRGLLKMTKEHIGILLYLKIPFIVLMTRVDITPEIISDSQIKNIEKLLSLHKRKMEIINSHKDQNQSNIDLEKKENGLVEDLKTLAKKLQNNPYIVPLITISNKTGYYVKTCLRFLSYLNPRPGWGWGQNQFTNTNTNQGSIFYIDSKFTPPGIGLVLSGLVKGMDIKKNQDMLIGPFGNELKSVRIWSIHNNNKLIIEQLGDKQRGCLAIKSIDKKNEVTKDLIRKGMIMISNEVTQNICYQFTASIEVLHHSTVISKKYTPVIHCGTVRQSAKIILQDEQVLQTGNRAEVRFRFIKHPEFIEPGMTFFFREGTTRGFGTIIDILCLKDDPNPKPAAAGRRRSTKYLRKGKKIN